MNMPRGKKFSNGYCSIASIPSAKNYKEISSICAKRGMKIGPSNVRNVLLSAMQKIVKPICDANALSVSEESLAEIAKNPRFQMSIASIISEDF